MSDNGPVRIAWARRSVVFGILAAILIGLVGLAIVEASSDSLLFRTILDVDYRLPVGPVVYLGSVLLAAALFLVDRVHPFSGWFAPSRENPAGPTVGLYDWVVAATCLSVIVVLIWHSFDAPIDAKLTDYFHEGEILVGLPIIRHAGEVPILIHGPGRNLLPGALALHYAQPGHEIAFMRFVTGLGTMATLLMVAATTYVVAFALLDGWSSISRRHSISAVASLLATFVAFNQAHVSNRHVLFLSALGLAAAIFHTANRKQGLALTLSVGFGVVCALAPVYVYATGIETLAIAVIAAVILLLRHGLVAFRLVGAALAAFTACVILIFALDGGDLYLNAIRDVLWWAVEARGIWNLPLWERQAITHVTLLAATIALAGYLASQKARSKDPAERRCSDLLALLAFAVAISARTMLERSDAAHTGYSMLTVAIGLGALAAPLISRLAARSPGVLAVLGVAVALVAMGGDPRKIYEKFHSSGTPEVARLSTPDTDILSDDIRAFTQRYDAELAKAGCLLVLTNEGVLNYAADLPPCGDFTYPVYASVPAGDRRLADWLQANPQHIAVVETDFWSGNIDGKPMSSRLPQVWTLVKKTMPARERIDSRVFAVSP